MEVNMKSTIRENVPFTYHPDFNPVLTFHALGTIEYIQDDEGKVVQYNIVSMEITDFDTVGSC